MNYYRKPINKTVDDIKLKMQIGSLTVKMTENINKINDLVELDKNIKKDVIHNSNSIKNFYTKQEILDITNQYYLKNHLYDKDYIDNNLLLKSEIDSKDKIILSKVNDHFYSRSCINTNYYLKNYIDKEFYTKEYINDNYYDKNHLNNNFNNLYNRQYLDLKFDNIYNKTEINDKTSKLDRNIVLFNNNLTKFIDETYNQNKKILEDDILDNKNKFNNFLFNIFSTFSNNVSNLNNKQNQRLSDLENVKINDMQINKLNQLENIDLNRINSSYNFTVFNKQKVDKLKYYTKEFILHNIDLNRNFTLSTDMDEILINNMSLHSREFLINDVLKFYLNVIIKFQNCKSIYYTMYMRFDILYDDETLIKSFKRYMTSKGSVYLNTATFNICRIVKIFRNTSKILFRIYFCRVTTNNKILVQFDLTNEFEKNYLDIEWLSNV